VCRLEAPGVEQFARAHSNDVTVVGLGTQDDLSQARDFVKRYGATFQMLWDSSSRSWRSLGIAGQPAAILLAPDGSEIKRWLGPFDEDEVLRLSSRY
jgi:peroxiredoxin